MSNNPFPYHLSDRTLTFYVDGAAHQVMRDNAAFGRIMDAVEAGDVSAVEMVRPARKVLGLLEDLTPNSETERWFRRKAGEIEITDWGVTLDGIAIHGHVIDRLLDVLNSGLNATPWVNFVRKLHQNPSSMSRGELYGWLEKSGMPITSDGDFLAYKRVRSDYRDIHSGTFDNSVGSICEMSRLDVDDDRTRTCSAGLHFASKDYLPHFSHQGNDDRIVIVKINPADVVSIPADYNDAKGRTWRYVVVGEMSLEEAGLHQWDPIVDEYDEYDLDEFEDEFEDEDEDEFEDWEIDLISDLDTPINIDELP